MNSRESPKKNVDGLWRLVSLLGPYRLRLFLASLCVAAGSLVSLSYPQVARYAIDVGVGGGSITALDQVISWLVLIVIVHAILVWCRHYLMSWLGLRAATDLRNLVFGNMMSLSVAWFHERRSGEMVARLAADAAIIEDVVSSQMSMAVRNTMQLVGGIVLLCEIDWKLAGIMLAIIPPLSIGAVYFGGKIRKQSRTVQDRLAAAAGRVQEAVGAIETVQACGRETDEAYRYRGKVEDAFVSGVSLVFWRASFMACVSGLTYVSLGVILLVGGRAVVVGRISAGDLTAFLIYAGLVANSFATIAGLYGALNKAAGATERLYAVCDAIPKIADKDRPLVLPRGRGAVRFQNVYFRYDSRPEVPVLTGVNIDIAPGEIVALVGTSGAGKTTIASLLPRFYDVQSGTVFLEGVDIRDLRLAELRSAMSIVPQDPVLFSGTIRENIAYPTPTASDQTVVQAARNAHVHDFVASFTDGYDTVVGERGVKLSGGQRQRIAIARAFVADPRILILDEATSNLDSDTESIVQQALHSLMQGRTTLVIAHRLSTVREADRICVVSQGRVQEQGTHSELMDTSDTYRRLVERQLVAR